jgi:hypothetical protein
MIRRGEMRWYRFAQPDKRRPVVILTRDSAIEFLGETSERSRLSATAASGQRYKARVSDDRS